jgi:hypothetical protein
MSYILKLCVQLRENFDVCLTFHAGFTKPLPLRVFMAQKQGWLTGEPDWSTEERVFLVSVKGQ